MKLRMRALGVVCAAALLATGCGNLTIRSWVKLITDQSTGTLKIPDAFPQPIPINRLEGGFLGVIVLDTTTIPAPVNGTVTIDDIRIAGDTHPVVTGMVCVWQNPTQTSTGTINLDILGSQGSATLNLNLRATAEAADVFQEPPAEISQSATLPLNNIGIMQLLNAAETGSSDGLFATTAAFTGSTEILGFATTFELNLVVSNESTPPMIDADELNICGKHFAEMGTDVFYGINSKSSYLLTGPSDKPAAPTIIKLADIGAKAGDKLKVARVGTYNDQSELKDGNETNVGAVFSSSNVVKDQGQRNRIPGAINAGTDFRTPAFVTCIFWPFCSVHSTDISQDFNIKNSPTVTIPTGAQYLILGTVPDSLTWNDNSGFGLGVSLTVNPS